MLITDRRARLVAASLIALGPFLVARPAGQDSTATQAVRLPDIPYLGANAGKPDLGGKGMWDVKRIYDMAAKEPGIDAAQTVPFTPKGQAVYQQRLETLQKDDPEARCLPPGIPRMLYTPYPTQIFQLADRIVFIYEGGAHIWRVIWLDGRQHPSDPDPTWLGDSIGRWDGDTLIVDVVGFNDKSWLDNAGHPHGEKLHVIERFTRPRLDTLRYEATIEDPEYYTRPWTVALGIKWVAGQELLEYICQENNRDVEHLVGK